MEPVLIILFITIAGSSGMRTLRHCETALSRCDTFTPADMQRTMRNFPPNEEELREICPPALEAIECLSAALDECTGELFDELEASDKDTVAQAMRTFQNVKRLMQDVCNEDSQLGKDFRESAPCIRRILSEMRNKDDCRSEGHRLYEAFRFPESSDEDEGEEEMDMETLDKLIAESRCLTAAYEMACTLKDIQKSCGSVARDVLLQVVKRAEMLKMRICSEEDILTLRGQFLDFLEEQGEHRAFLANAFEFRKRRK